MFAQSANRDRPELVLQSGHSSVVLSVSYSPDGRWLASASGDSTIKLWDVDTGRSFRTLTGHLGTVLELAFSPDWGWAASAGAGGEDGLWVGRSLFGLGFRAGEAVAS